VAWSLGLAASLVIMFAYGAISLTIARSLDRSNQLRTNRLGTATAAIFGTCAIGHGFHALHLIGWLDSSIVSEARASYDWHLAGIDLLTAGVGVWYWSLRSAYHAVLEGPALFSDLEESRRRALELNDTVVQALTTASFAVELGQRERAKAAVDDALTRTRGIIDGLLAEAGPVTPGSLIREEPAALDLIGLETGLELDPVPEAAGEEPA
jgi:hypothetical protein